MFLCKDCVVSSIHRMFDLEIALSFGYCEACGEAKPCVDISCNFIDQQKRKEKLSKKVKS